MSLLETDICAERERLSLDETGHLTNPFREPARRPVRVRLKPIFSKTFQDDVSVVKKTIRNAFRHFIKMFIKK